MSSLQLVVKVIRWIKVRRAARVAQIGQETTAVLENEIIINQKVLPAKDNIKSTEL